MLIENNDLANDGVPRKADISKPIKGDIYFDGIEAEALISNVVSESLRRAANDILKINVHESDKKGLKEQLAHSRGFFEGLRRAAESIINTSNEK